MSDRNVPPGLIAVAAFNILIGLSFSLGSVLIIFAGSGIWDAIADLIVGPGSSGSIVTGSEFFFAILDLPACVLLVLASVAAIDLQQWGQRVTVALACIFVVSDVIRLVYAPSSTFGLAGIAYWVLVSYWFMRPKWRRLYEVDQATTTRGATQEEVTFDDAKHSSSSSGQERSQDSSVLVRYAYFLPGAYVLAATGFWVVAAVAVYIGAADFANRVFRLLVGNDEYTRRKLELARVASEWKHLIDLPLVIFCFLYLLNMFCSAWIVGSSGGSSMTFLREGLAQFVFVPDAFSLMEDVEQATAWTAVGQGLAIFVLPMALLVLAARLAHIIYIPMKLRRPLSSDGESEPVDPAVGPAARKQRMAVNANVVINFLFVVLSSAIALVLGTEVLRHVFGYGTLSAWTTPLLRWVYVPNGTLGPTEASALRLNGVTWVLLLILVSPLLLCVVVRISVVTVGFTKRFTDKKAPEWVRQYVETVSEDANVRCPVVVVERNRASNVYTRIRSVGRPRVVVTTGAFDLFSQPQLEAALAHEIGHVKRDVSAIRVLRLLSNLCVFCPNYLILCFDFVRAESEADAFALSIGVERDALESAIAAGSERDNDNAEDGLWNSWTALKRNV